MFVPSRAFLLDIATIAIQAAGAGAAAGPLDAAKIHLATAGPSPNVDTVLGDWTETVEVQLAAKTLTWETPRLNLQSEGEDDADVEWVLATALTGPVAIMGYFVTDSAGLVYLGGEAFAAGKAVSLPGDSIVLKPFRVSFPPNTQSNNPVG